MDPKVRLNQTWNRYADLYVNRLTNEQDENDEKAAANLVHFNALPDHLSAACLVLHCLSTESSLRCVCHRVCLSIAACRTLLLPKICSIVKSCDSADALWERHSDILSDQAIFLANLIRDTSTCEDGSFKAAVWSLLVYVAGLKRMSI